MALKKLLYGFALVLVGCSSTAMPTDTVNIVRSVDTQVATYQVTVADSPKERAKGLQGYTSLGDDEGMLFIFLGSGSQSFWNKDVLFPIDIIFVDSEARIINFFENVPPCDLPGNECPLYTSDGEAQYVLELNGGQVQEKGIRERDRLVSTLIE